MKHLLLYLSVILLFTHCATVDLPEIVQFEADKYQLNAGDEVTVYWSVNNADYVDISGVGTNLPSTGMKKLVLQGTQTFKLRATKGEKFSSEKSLTISVLKEQKKEEEQPSHPVVENKNTQKSKYVKGIINPTSVKTEDRVSLKINLIDHKNYPKTVRVYCTIVDEYGNQIANLAPPYNYQYLENWRKVAEIIAGKEYLIEKFEVEEVRFDNSPPFSVLIVLDYSGSMAKDINFLEIAYYQGIKFLKPLKDDFSVVQFDHRIVNPISSSTNFADATNIYGFNDLAGATAFYDASIFGISGIKNNSKEKVAVFFTDGMDNASFFNVNDLINVARENNVKVFVIGFNRPFGGFYPYILEALALQTGGKAYFPTSISELSDIFSEIFRIINVYYVLTFSATKVESNERTIQVAFDFPIGNQKLVAQKDYFVEPQKLPYEENKRMIAAFFESGKSEISADSKESLKKISELLKLNPNKKIRIIGHTDTKGSEAFNLVLSKKRAQQVYNMLVRFGVSKKQIEKVEGKGEKEPIYPNEQNEYEFRENRRVELILF